MSLTSPPFRTGSGTAGVGKVPDENDIIRRNADAMRCAWLRTQALERNHSAESVGQ